MGEGNTPLVSSRQVGARVGLHNLFFKLESCNPSGSYKDRFVAAQMQAVLDMGVDGCIATSSGNTGASLAAYSARCGLACSIVVNDEAPAGKLQQMRAHGARVMRVRDFITSPTVTAEVYTRLSELSDDMSIPLIVSAYRHCPVGMAGVETIAYELGSQCRTRIDHVFVPIGGGGLFTAVCRGFRRRGGPLPRIHGVQPEGCLTVVAAYLRGDDEIRPIRSTTRISGLAVPFDIDAGMALAEMRALNGVGIAIRDEEVHRAQQLMLTEEGIWAEPAGAAALAGAFRAAQEGIVAASDVVICIVTGHGFKDPASVADAAERHPVESVECTQLTREAFEVRA
ncbi:MAG: pyridoxal-phosphate dependent enzyme [Luteitalea sp.]|nr:pyridoxal-phosphate dependent enzyme [Luteitalea sp.]